MAGHAPDAVPGAPWASSHSEIAVPVTRQMMHPAKGRPIHGAFDLVDYHQFDWYYKTFLEIKAFQPPCQLFSGHEGR
jgi:hypothetical protein